MFWKYFDAQSKIPDSKVHGAHMGLTWGRQVPGGPHVGLVNFVIWVDFMTWKRYRIADTLCGEGVLPWSWSPADSHHKGAVIRNVDAFLLLAWTSFLPSVKLICDLKDHDTIGTSL